MCVCVADVVFACPVDIVVAVDVYSDIHHDMAKRPFINTNTIVL